MNIRSRLTLTMPYLIMPTGRAAPPPQPTLPAVGVDLPEPIPLRTSYAGPAGPRLLVVGGIGLLHVVVYFIVTRLTLFRPGEAFIDPRVGLDDRIPHLAWTWPAYWLPYALVPIAAVASIGRLDARAFRRLIVAWAGMILAGGVIQVVWPAVAPWPVAPALTQRLYHDSALILPYATLPSMHVAHVAMAAIVTATVFPSFAVRVSGVLSTLLVAVATLTLKEHLVLDAVSGLALAIATGLWWRRGLR